MLNYLIYFLNYLFIKNSILSTTLINFCKKKKTICYEKSTFTHDSHLPLPKTKDKLKQKK